MSLTIESLFTVGGTPTIGLSPTIRIWEIIGITKTLIIGPSAMVDVGDGFYLYEFTTGLGYDDTKSYTSLVDGGVNLPPNERYQTINYEPCVSTTIVSSIASAVWEEPMIAHMTVGTTGEALNQISADTTQIRLDIVTLLDWVNQLLKYNRNKTKIDIVNKELIVYDDNGTTVFKRFQLKDSNGVLSVTEVCERLPI